MNEPDHLPEEVKDSIDAYLAGTLDEASLRALEDRLRSDPVARDYFVRYCRLHIDLHLEVRAWKAGERVLSLVGGLPATGDPAPPPGRLALKSVLSGARVLTAGVLVLVLAGVLAFAWLWSPGPDRTAPLAVRPPTNIAWLVNARDCEWAAGLEPAGDVRPGKRLRLERGLAELCFKSDARVVLEGPAELVLVSERSAELLRGRLTARVPERAAGFTVLLPRGQVVDLGTEFGVEVADNGSSVVRVFEGKVEAVSPGSQAPVPLKTDQAASLSEAGVVLQPEGARVGETGFVRSIRRAPHTLTLDFRREVASPLRDGAGRGTGLTHRLPGTGGRLPGNDPNLSLDAGQGRLELSPTESDLHGQRRLDEGEYLGVRLADLGFTGREDFAVTAVIPNIPALQDWVGQFGLYAGAGGDRNIRGGLLSRWQEKYNQFLVHNHGGLDSDLYMVGLLSVGHDLRLTLKRMAGKYTLTVEDETTGETSTLAIRSADFLEGEKDLYVGLFAASQKSKVSGPLVVKKFEATVWVPSR